jgi:hypothetical protein
MHATFCRTPHLVLSSATLRELKRNTTASQLSVNFRVSIESVVNASLLLLIKNNLQDLATIFLGAETLADNLNGVDEICEDGVVNSSQCPGTGSLLCERGSGAVGSLWAGENTTSGENQDMTVRELLFKLTGETVLRQQNPQWVERKRKMDEKTYRCCTRWKP